MKLERVLHFHQSSFAFTEYFADKRELYLYSFIDNRGEFAEKHTLLLRLNQCLYFRILPGATNRLGDAGLVSDGLYRAVGVGKNIEIPEFDRLPTSGGTPYVFRSATDFLYLAVASSHEVLRTWPPDQSKSTVEQ